MILCEKCWAWIGGIVAAGVKLWNFHDKTAVDIDDDVHDDKYRTVDIITQPTVSLNGPWHSYYLQPENVIIWSH